MLFNTFEFIFFFLPIVWIGYFLLKKVKLVTGAKLWLIAGSLFFYSWWNIAYLPLLLGSLFVNFGIGTLLSKKDTEIHRKAVLTWGIVLNAALLGYFKYSDFFLMNVNAVMPGELSLLNLALPLAISFFTFQQIAYLVDAYRFEAKDYTFLDYALFVTFFPQLIAGPIVHHKEVMPQFEKMKNHGIQLNNVSAGLFIFTMGLFKKVGIADTLSVFVNEGFRQPESLTFIEGWAVSLSYTFQLYYDFSGYSDMAIGAALLFNIKLPVNFFSPYKALSIQDFWRRWHMTLSQFLTKYIYIPLGGNRKGRVRTLQNIMIVFLISGFWHGAGWTFIFWGFLHGLASVVQNIWKSFGLKLNKYAAWFITFNFVNAAWVFFKAETMTDAWLVLKSMAGLNGFVVSSAVMPPAWAEFFQSIGAGTANFSISMEQWDLWFLFAVLILTLSLKNSIQWKEQFKPTIAYSVAIAVLFSYSILNLTKISEFIYFNF
ncbi:MBOAT family O-acyltransferase [Metabacillus sp. 113a]|uniref:MBOAT family O-acyltransferase n=1 Tax=Metabacillus sp. 113a TaxID=3404706 RepID=UPI003CF91B36